MKPLCYVCQFVRLSEATVLCMSGSVKPVCYVCQFVRLSEAAVLCMSVCQAQ